MAQLKFKISFEGFVAAIQEQELNTICIMKRREKNLQKRNDVDTRHGCAKYMKKRYTALSLNEKGATF